MALLALAGYLDDIGRSLREASFMFWETLWALVLGFSLSGIVQAFVSKDAMQAALGRRSPKAISRATGFGMASSSCSYAASAMSKSLFAKGADFITAMVFMIASTNLVLELGLILLVLMGWQFMAAEFVGGPIMILLLVALGGLFITAPLIKKARAKVDVAQVARHITVTVDRQAELENEAWSRKLRSPAGWSDASSYAVADVTMLRRELLIGYLVAGFLAVSVPMRFWNSLFIHGHGIWTVIENALVGPIIAVIAWVCSVGNVPLAAALWSGGISFGGVIAFIFADLIAMPLILIYAKFYGWQMTLRLVALFYVVMVAAGLVTQIIFRAAGLIPEHGDLTVMHPKFEWNYTTYLNVVCLVLGAGVWWLARNRARFGGGVDYAIDPVCGMQVRRADAPSTAQFEGTTSFFCSDRCRIHFESDPSQFAQDTPPSVLPDTVSTPPIEPMAEPTTAGFALDSRVPALTPHVDPICQMTIDPHSFSAVREFEGVAYYFCSPRCAMTFDADARAALEHSAHHGSNPARG